MKISQKQYLNHGNTNHFVASKKPKECIKIPKSLIQSRSSILKLLPFQKDPSIMGSRLFWAFLLTFMQVEHYDINFTKKNSLMKQIKLSSASKQEENSEDVMPIGQIVKIRSRKVSFGVINTIDGKDGKEQKEKKSNQVNNIWIIVNNDDQLKINKIKQRQERLHQLMRKIKLLVYEQARKIDLQGHSVQISQSKLSISTIKALSILFPKKQNTLYQQKKHIHTILSLLDQSEKQSQSKVFRSHANDLMKVLEIIAKEKILNTSSNGQNPIKNILSLLQYFGLQQGEDFHLISSSLQDQNFKKLSYDESGRRSIHSMVTSNAIGIDFKHGFFKMSLTTQGYIVTIDIDKVQGINQSVHQQFRNSLVPSKSQQQVYQPSNTSSSDPSVSPSVNQNHFQFSTPSQFISRYNKRYFKNQRMLYKQKSRVENRFIQHQVDSLLSPDNYDGGYQILINSNHKDDGNRNINNGSINQNGCGKQEVTNDLGLEQNQLQDEINGLFGDSEQENLVQVQQEIEDYRKAAIRERNRNNFFFQENHSTLASSKQVDSEIFNKANTTALDSQLIKPETQTGLYTREDFWISDDEILDDIERVLI